MFEAIDISLIIPLYKGGKYCARLLEMIEKNSLYKNLFKKCKIEVIFVNDFPDEKIIIEKGYRVFDVKIIRQERNSGIHASRVKGIINSRGNYIIMLDQDDLVTENWLYSQWNKIVSEKGEYCVCNGWKGRFRVLWTDKNVRERLNNLNFYFAKKNAILSPGQVIIKKKCLPIEWLENIQKCNGADDFLLWIIALKKGNKFLINNEYLYYHTPERNQSSINSRGMIKSLKETLHILSSIGLITEEEIQLLNNQIEVREYLEQGEKIEAVDKESVKSRIEIGEYIKYHKMFQILMKWMWIRGHGIKIDRFFLDNSYFNIAIYGMGYLGECLYYELLESDVNVKYGIDHTAVDFRKELSIYRIEDDLAKVDAVVLTIAEAEEAFVEKVRKKMNCPVLMISEILLESDGDLV